MTVLDPPRVCGNHPSSTTSASASALKGRLGAGENSDSWASSPAVRRVMQGNRSRDTRPELAVRSSTHARGLRFRVCTRPVRELACTADMVFPRAKVAVFIDGCFWHGCPTHYRQPKTNPQYWDKKIGGNIARDRRNTDVLAARGWRVLRFWTHDEIESIARQIVSAVRQQP
jgi:DNA mismatch endonuclease, patch repair protein